VVLAGVALLIARTRLGLFVRGVTQNRRMAACMGVNTARVDTYAFALGSGIAGLAGCALVAGGQRRPGPRPELHRRQLHGGGAGRRRPTGRHGVRRAGPGRDQQAPRGLGRAVLAKIMVLVFIVIFIQKRPQGMFAMKGRSAEA
jgi:urea transport system permease protein